MGSWYRVGEPESYAVKTGPALMMKNFWKRGFGLLLKSFLLLKTIQLTKFILTIRPGGKFVNIEDGLGHIYDRASRSIKILNERNATFLLEPEEECSELTDVLMMVSSGPRYRKNRDRWRKDVEGLTGVKLVFLIAKPPDEGTQQRVTGESAIHGDIVQSSVVDGHRRLGYKILSGYVWSYLHCDKVGYVAKSDDNVELDLIMMMEALKARTDITEDFIGCSTPNRNSKTLRSARPHMSGNWSISKQQFDLLGHHARLLHWVPVCDHTQGGGSAGPGGAQAVQGDGGGADRGLSYHWGSQGEA